MNRSTLHPQSHTHLFRKQRITFLEQIGRVGAAKKTFLKLCAVGAVIGLIVGFSIPYEYMASVLVVHESSHKRSSSGISALTNMMDGIPSSTARDRDAIYPSLYLKIVNSTPFLLRLFDVKVQRQQDSTAIPLAQYMKEYQKRPWWSGITSAPFRLISLGMSLFTPTGNEQEVVKTKTDTDVRKAPFRLSREETAIARAIASRINIEIDQKKRTIALHISMQDPRVAAIVADTLQSRLREYVTEYRTSKARRLLKYNETLCKEAQAEYYKAQDKYTRYADVNQNLAMLASRSELASLQNEMVLALNTYNQMEKQVQAAKARVESVIPVYTVIQPVTVPLHPSKPNRILILAGCLLLSITGAIGWILYVKDFIEKIKARRTVCQISDSRWSRK